MRPGTAGDVAVNDGDNACTPAATPTPIPIPTPSPTIVVMLSTKTDIVWNFAARVTSPRAMVIASTPTAIGSRAATSAPKASTRTTRVTGSTRCSPRAVSSALIERMS